MSMFAAFLFGTIIGSFLNVCIYRIPQGQSLLHPGSHCPNCGVTVRWYQNVPLLSFVFLGGRCINCKVPISVRYPIVEGLTGLLFALVFHHFGAHPATLIYWIFVAALVAITFIDLDHQIIPDVISIPGILAGFSCSFFLPWMSWTDSVFGILLGGGSLYLVAVGYELITKNEGMGGGDIKLLAMIGAFMGWKAVLPIVFLSSLLGCLVGIPVMLIQKADRKLAIPFGPFLASAAIIFLLFGGRIIQEYLAFVGVVNQ